MTVSVLYHRLHRTRDGSCFVGQTEEYDCKQRIIGDYTNAEHRIQRIQFDATTEGARLVPDRIEKQNRRTQRVDLQVSQHEHPQEVPTSFLSPCIASASVLVRLHLGTSITASISAASLGNKDRTMKQLRLSSKA